MERASHRRNVWKEREVVCMLTIIKKFHISKLLDHKTKRNISIYEDIAKKMASKGINKQAHQIRSKYKSLKSEYYKAKRKNSTSGVDPLNLRYFDILDELLGSHHSTEASVGLNMSEILCVEDSSLNDVVIFKEEITDEDVGNDSNFEDVLPSVDIIKEEFLNEGNDSNSFEVFPVDIFEDKSANENIENDSNDEFPNLLSPANPRQPCKTFKVARKQTYQKVMENFTKEWKQTQKNLIKVLEQQEEKYIANMDRLMEKNRNETRKLLAEDRDETEKMLTRLLSSFQTPSEHPMPNWYRQNFPHDDNDDDGDNECLTSTSGIECGSVSPKEEPQTP